jgi:hypothetical protein
MGWRPAAAFALNPAAISSSVRLTAVHEQIRALRQRVGQGMEYADPQQRTGRLPGTDAPLLPICVMRYGLCWPRCCPPPRRMDASRSTDSRQALNALRAYLRSGEA